MSFVLNVKLDELTPPVRLMMEDIINILNNGTYQRKVYTDNVSNPPTDAELDAIFGEPAEVGAGFMAVIDDNGADTNVYIVYSTGVSWWQGTLGKCL